MPADRRARPTSARRPGGAVAPPAQRRRKQAALSAEARGRATAAPAAQRGAKSALPLSAPPRFSRDQLLGYGAALSAILAAISLSVNGLVFLIGLGYAAFAFLGQPDKRDWRLRQAAWAFAILILATVFLSVYVTIRPGSWDPDNPNSLVYLSMGAASMVLTIVSQALLALVAILVGLALGREGGGRLRLLSWSGVCAVFYYVLLLPGAVVVSQAPPALGSFWTEPLVYGSVVLGVLAGAAIACAFLWDSTAGDEAAVGTRPQFGTAEREYLLAVGAFSLLLPNLIPLVFVRWSSLGQRADETLSDAVVNGAVVAASLLYLPLLFASAAAAFWVSARRAAWRPSRWLAAPATPRPSAKEFFLSWRLPLLYGWLIVLIAVCSFLGWYGFLAAAPAAAHYVWMLARCRRVSCGGLL